jgi:hypothetical protein
MSSHPVFSEFGVALSLVFYVVFCRSLFVFFVLLPLTIVLFVLQFTDSDNHFGISILRGLGVKDDIMTGCQFDV